MLGGYLATEHLIKGGRRHIAFFGDIQLPEVSMRYEGYCKALAAHDIARESREQNRIAVLRHQGLQVSRFTLPSI